MTSTNNSTPTSTPTPTPTPGGTTSALREAIAEARSVLAGLIDSGEVERVPGIILDRRLRLADRFLGLGMEERALQHLDMFVRTVERYRGDGISEEAADELIAEVQPIVDAVERDPLLPSVTCVEELADGWIGHFGFVNPNDSIEVVPVGALNRFDPAPEDRGQPTSFEPGTHEDLFTVAYEDEALTWRLDGNEATASGESPRCEAPPPVPVTTTTTIDYEYDPLYRLVEANYDSREYFHYAYDAVGNRLTQSTHLAANTYAYDAANRLIEVDDEPYTWDAKGNLLEDDTRIYTYDHANRLTSVVMGADAFTFVYNGLGDRLRQTINGTSENYTLDLVAGLTQVLGDGTNRYLYGVGRIRGEGPSGFTYHMGDALGSVRQIVGASSELTFAQSFEPFGSHQFSAGINPTSYGFTGEWTDHTDLINLRARYYDPTPGRFFQPDPWSGDLMRPDTFTIHGYVNNNPINSTDPSGQCYGPVKWLRDIPLEDINCKNLDLALTIYGHPNATYVQKSAASAYIGAWGISHVYLVAGLIGTGVGGVDAILAWAGPYVATAPIRYPILKTLFTAIGVGTESYLTYRAIFCDDIDAAGILYANWIITGFSFVEYIGQQGFNYLGRSLSRQSFGTIEAFNARAAKPEIIQNILDDIDPTRFKPTSRFGRAFYLAEFGETAVAEVPGAKYVIRYQVDLSRAIVLDLTNPEIAAAVGYIEDVTMIGAHQELAGKAIDLGYNVIKYNSYRGPGVNYAILDSNIIPFDWTSWLEALILSPTN